MKPGDKVTISKGPYAGKSGTIRGRCNAYDTKDKSIRRAWTVWIEKVVELVFEDEIKENAKCAK